jgi:hypothetical protein
MSDIFISYASEDLPRIRPLVDALERRGWSVFWDRTIPAGKTWREVIGNEPPLPGAWSWPGPTPPSARPGLRKKPTAAGSGTY